MLRTVVLIATAVLQYDRGQCSTCKEGINGCTWEHEKLGDHLIFMNMTTEHRLRSFYYDRSIRPFYLTDRPTAVYVEIYVVRLGPVDQGKLEYEMDIFLRQRWVDPRLTDPTRKGKGPRPIHYALKQDMWVPDLIFINEMKSSFHEFTVPNQLLHILPNGRITFSQRLTLSLLCIMDLQRYPLDSQSCTLRLESYSSSTTDVTFLWTDKGIIVDNTSPYTIPEFKMDNVQWGNCTSAYSTGQFPCINGSFHFTRQLNYYLMQFYLPTSLIVILSWVSFWIDEEHIPARVSLGILTVLTMTSQSETISSQLPRASYIKAADVWLSTCLLFAFAALVEFCLMSVLQRELHLVQLAEEIKRWELIATHELQIVAPHHSRSSPVDLAEPKLPTKVKFKDDYSASEPSIVSCSSGSCTCSLYSDKSAYHAHDPHPQPCPASGDTEPETAFTDVMSSKTQSTERRSILSKSGAAMRRLSDFTRDRVRGSRALHGTSYRSPSTLRSSIPTRRPAPCVTKCFNFSRKQRDPLIDNMSKIVFPISFAVFNLIYWCYYLS